MTLCDIAKLAGVSPSTVSRVVNNHPRVAPETAEMVRRIMEQTRFRPRRRVNGGERGTLTIAFLVFGVSGLQIDPAFEHLLRGVSLAAADHDAEMVFAFISDSAQLPMKVLERRVDGLLLHGECPSPEVQSRLQAMPTVWLMSNGQRPAWGDQVMPDDTAIGEIAARYLVGHGHRRLAVMSLAWGLWTFDMRAMSFTLAAAGLGAEVETLRPSAQAEDSGDVRDLPKIAEATVDRMLQLDSRPTALFVVEDRQLPLIDVALRRHGLRPGPDGDIELVSCTNERPHLMGLNPIPATIDIRAEAIGRRGVELLLARLHGGKGATDGRVRTMVEPALVEPAR